MDIFSQSFIHLDGTKVREMADRAIRDIEDARKRSINATIEARQQKLNGTWLRRHSFIKLVTFEEARNELEHGGYLGMDLLRWDKEMYERSYTIAQRVKKATEALPQYSLMYVHTDDYHVLTRSYEP
jgi:hypothetical protein